MHDYSFPAEVPVDIAHTLDQLTVRFRSVKDGLPELVKNSKDQYSRLGVHDREVRQIVVLASVANRCIGVLDFAGARAEDFQGWTTWSSRFAGRAELAGDIEAGHGNGGKAFMVRGATHESFLESCFEGKRTRMGFRNDLSANKYKPGYAREHGAPIDDLPEPNPEARLRDFLDEFGLTFDALPTAAQRAFQGRSAFTGAYLSRVVEWEERRQKTIRRLASDDLVMGLAGHGQTALTVETCEVWVICDGALANEAPITPIQLEPYPGFEEALEIEIPERLPDPETAETIDIAKGEPGKRILRLRTSKRQLQMGEDTKARNVIRVWNDRNNVGTWPLHSLGILITSVSFIYGELRCPYIKEEHLAGAERVHLADTPLVRAIKEWTRQQVQSLAEELHRKMMAESRPKDREQAHAALRSIRELMRKYLDPDASGIEEDEQEGEKGTAGKGKRKTKLGAEYGERLDQIVLEADRPALAIVLGSNIPFIYRCLQREDDGATKPLRNVAVALKCVPDGLVQVDSEARLRGLETGRGAIWLEGEGGAVVSNRVNIEIVGATGVDIIRPEDSLLQGQRLKIPITFRTEGGPRDDILIDASIDEPDMGLIGRSGRFTAGLKQGEATLRVRFGPEPAQQGIAIIHIGPDRMPVTGQGGGHGADIPEILLCGEEAPGMEDYPPEQRTHPGGEEHPTIIEEPQFRNAVWINPNSKEATRVRRSRGGPSGVGGIATATFMHFVAQKCFDVLKRLYVRQQIRDRSVTETEFIQLWALAEMECADFIDSAWEISDELLSAGRPDA